MKRLMSLTIVLIAASVFFQGCGVFSEIGESRENKIPFSVKEYSSDANYYRSLGHGKSPNLSFAKETTLHDAQGKLARKIYHDNPHNKRTENVIKQNLIYLNVAKEKCSLHDNGIYSCWIILETSKRHY